MADYTWWDAFGEDTYYEEFKTEQSSNKSNNKSNNTSNNLDKTLRKAGIEFVKKMNKDNGHIQKVFKADNDANNDGLPDKITGFTSNLVINPKTINMGTPNDSSGALSFEIPNWGIKDFINERTYWLKGTNLTAGNEPGWFYFKVFFKFNTGYGLFGGLFDDEYSGNSEVYNSILPENAAIQYLSSLKKFTAYKSENISDRILALYKFSSMLFDTTIKTPWSIKGISNLQNALNINLTNFSEEKSFDLLFNTETVDMRLSTMMDLYKFICYDDINCKEILPENLRKFDMSVIFYHMPLKYMQTGVSLMQYNNTEKMFGKTNNILNTINKVVGSNKWVNTGVNIIQGICDIAQVFTSKSLIYDYKTLFPKNEDFSNVMSYKMLTFHNCEIDTSSFGKYLDNVEIKNEKPFQFGNTALKIKYDRVYYHNMNEWNEFMFGSDGFYYNVYNPKNIDYLYGLSNDEAFIGIKKDKDGNTIDNIWHNRIKALSDANLAAKAHAASPLSDTQYKAILDYSEIAINNALRDFGMEDLVTPDVYYDPTTGNLYNNFTKISNSAEYVLGKSFIKDKDERPNLNNGWSNLKAKYFSDKMGKLVDKIYLGNLFGSLCSESNIDISPKISNYLDYKLKKLNNKDDKVPYKENSLKYIINDALTVYNKGKKEDEQITLLIDSYKNTEQKNIYGGNFSAHTSISQQMYNDAKIISPNIFKHLETQISKQFNTTLSEVDSYTYFNKYLLNKNYFGEKIISTLGININNEKGNIYSYDLMFTNDKDGKKIITTNLFSEKMKMFDSVTPILNENIYTYNFSDYIHNKLSKLKSNNVTGNIYDADLMFTTGSYGKTIPTSLFLEKMKMFDSITPILNENIYTYDFSDYIHNKLSKLKSNNVTGNIYDADLMFTYDNDGNKTTTSLFFIKMKMFDSTTSKLSGSIYGYSFSGEYFDNKIKNIKTNTGFDYTNIGTPLLDLSDKKTLFPIERDNNLYYQLTSSIYDSLPKNEYKETIPIDTDGKILFDNNFTSSHLGYTIYERHEENIYRELTKDLVKNFAISNEYNEYTTIDTDGKTLFDNNFTSSYLGDKLDKKYEQNIYKELNENLLKNAIEKPNVQNEKYLQDYITQNSKDIQYNEPNHHGQYVKDFIGNNVFGEMDVYNKNNRKYDFNSILEWSSKIGNTLINVTNNALGGFM